jgi:hypothetical protein
MESRIGATVTGFREIKVHLMRIEAGGREGVVKLMDDDYLVSDCHEAGFSCVRGIAQPLLVKICGLAA